MLQPTGALAHHWILALTEGTLKRDAEDVLAKMNAVCACLGLPVVAEGVETAEQRAFFAELGCAAFQGDHIGAVAQPLDMVTDYIKNRPLDLMDKA